MFCSKPRGIPRSLHLWQKLLALREHLAAGHAPPQTKQFRMDAMEESHRGQPDIATHCESLELKLAEADASISSTIEQRNASIAANEELKQKLDTVESTLRDLEQRRPWSWWAATAISTAHAVIAITAWAVTPPKVAGEALSESEIESVKGMRGGLLRAGP
ncbi:MAG: hypothetical protein AAFU85_20810 [Planctomycetota bacterium]